MAKFVETEKDVWINIEKIIQIEIVERENEYEYEIWAQFNNEQKPKMIIWFKTKEEAKKFIEKVVKGER